MELKTKITAGILIIGIGISFLFYRGCNMLMNNRTVKSKGYVMYSQATGIRGRDELVVYHDGSMDVKTYNKYFRHKHSSSKLFQDKNGDGLIDRIRYNAPEYKFHRSTILVRKFDYDDNKKEFENADSKLKQLVEKYVKK